MGGVAISSAIFQSRLETELRKRIHTPDAEQVRFLFVYMYGSFDSWTLAFLDTCQLITKIRQSARLVGQLPPDIQRVARDSYAISLKTVFVFSACSTLLAYLVRLPVRVFDYIPIGSVIVIRTYWISTMPFTDPREGP